MADPSTQASHDTGREYEIGDNEFLVLVSDKASNFAYANPAYCKASGYTWDELKGTITSRMLHKGTPIQLSMDMAATLRGKQPWTGIIKNKRKNGDYYWLRLNISPLYAHGKQYAGALLVHSKPTREEIAHFEPLYKLMCDGKNKDLILKHGKQFRLNAWGKTLLFIRSFGLNGLIWGGMVGANIIVALCLCNILMKFLALRSTRGARERAININFLIQ